MAKKSDSKNKKKTSGDSTSGVEEAPAKEEKTKETTSKTQETVKKEEPSQAKTSPQATSDDPEEKTSTNQKPSKQKDKETKQEPAPEPHPQADETKSEDDQEEKNNHNHQDDGKETPKEPKRFSFGLKRGKKKGQKQKADQSKKSTLPDDPVEPEEAINAVDQEIKVETDPSPEELAKIIDEQIQKAQENDFITLKLKKKTALLLMGLILLSAWAYPIYQLAKVGLGENLPFIDNYLNRDQQTHTEVEQPEKDQVDEEVRIRVKLAKDGDLDQAKAIATSLEENGFELVEIFEDQEETYEQSSIVTKKDQGELNSQIFQILSESYSLSSSSAQLSDDSDFQAVILVTSDLETIQTEKTNLFE